MFCIKGGIQVFSSKTAASLFKLLASHDDSVAGVKPESISINKYHQSQVYCAWKNGSVALFDFHLGLFIKAFSLQCTVNRIECHPTDEHLLIAVTETNVKIKKKGQSQPAMAASSSVKFYHLGNQEFLPKQFSIRQGIFKFLLVDDAAKWGLVVLRDTPLDYYIVDLSSGSIANKFRHTNPIACAAFHPNQQAVALGDYTGKIIISYCLGVEKGLKNPVTSLMHWHAHKVSSLAFTRDGVYLLSGGVEATLVIWQLDTRHKHFVPRLGSAIQSITISPSQTTYALTMMDNSLLFINANDMKIHKKVSGLRAASNSLAEYPISVGLQVDPKTGYLMMNGSPSQLQFVDAVTCENSSFELDLAIRNRVTMGKKTMRQPHIRHAKFSKEGDWLVTVDEREAPEFPHESFLKFWKWNKELQLYDCNSRIDAPHQKRITGVAFCPPRPGLPLMCATTSRDKTFKLWELLHQDSENERWVCRAVAGYKTFEGTSIAFSHDGSLLAIGFGGLITLWDPLSCSLQATLCFPSATTAAGLDIHHLEFLNGSPYLVAATKNTLHVWSLLSCSVLWSVKMEVTHLAVDNKTIHIFEPTSPVPVNSTPLSSPSYGIACNSDGSISCLDRNFELHRLTSQAPQEAEKEPVLINGHDAKSVFSSIYGKSMETPTTVHLPANVSPIAHEVLGFLSVPSHIIAPPSKLGSSILESLLASLALQPKEAPAPADDLEYTDASALLDDDETSAMDVDGIVRPTPKSDSASGTDPDEVTELAEPSVVPSSFGFLNDIFASLVVDPEGTPPSKRSHLAKANR
ncbi:WD repeat-containing protein 75 [Kappamyces sp. JEL0680]|nr:WD repeat-containing protein 75 [Kappamyces sp. JEL0680]